jgi:hypothetical protein
MTYAAEIIVEHNLMVPALRRSVHLRQTLSLPVSPDRLRGSRQCYD